MYLIAACFVFIFGVASGLVPRFNVVAKNVTVISGQTAVLPCSVDFLGDYKVVWMDHREKILTLEDRRIISDERISLERPYVKEWNLHVRNVRPSDAGTYTCQVNTDPVQFRPINLHVHEPARIIDHLSSSTTVVAKEGDTVELVCNVTGLPPPTVTWYRIPTGLMHDGDQPEEKEIGVDGEVLVIHNVTRYCDDVYKCVAFNAVPPAAQRHIRVYVEFPPEIRLPNRKLGQSKGKTTILECIVTAYPHAVNVWRRHGKPLERNAKYKVEVYDEDEKTLTLSLRIQSLSEEDYGEYECVSENKLGRDSETMILYEYPRYEPPMQPPIVTVTTPTTTRRSTTYRPYPGDGNGMNGGLPREQVFDTQDKDQNKLPGSDRFRDNEWPGGEDEDNVAPQNSGQRNSGGWSGPGYTYNSGQGSVIAEARNAASRNVADIDCMFVGITWLLASLMQR